jgi:hypothetical protein
MRQVIYIGVCIAALFYQATAQQLETKTIDLGPLYIAKDQAKDSTRDERIKVKILLKPGNATSAEWVIDNQTLSFGCTVLNPTIKLPKVKADSTIEVKVYLEILATKTRLRGDEFTKLRLSTDTSGKYPVFLRFTDRALYKPNKAFWVEIGSNFDLVDGLEPNNFFSGVFLHQKDIRPFLNKRNEKNLGIFAGVYESKAISNVNNDSFTHYDYYSSNSLIVTNATHPGKVKPGELGGFRDSVRVKTSQVVRNIALFLSPQRRITNHSANADGLHVFASLWIELQWQRIQLERNYSTVSRLDTISIPSQELPMYELVENGAITKKTEDVVDLKSHYYGVGLPIAVKHENTNVFINTAIGFSNQPRTGFSTSKQEIATLAQDRAWKGFYVFQFRLNEEQYGISFTGEVRGLLIANSPPIVSLALSKKFDLTKFIEFSK